MSEDNDILVTLLYANELNSIEYRKNFTFKHYAVIKKAKLLERDPRKYSNYKVNIQEFEDRAIKINLQLDCINHYYQELKTYGMKITYRDGYRTRNLMNLIKEHFPDFPEFQLEEGLKLNEFLKLLNGGIIYERQYL